jgi:50S ribosomal protein L16 3-hydroxylase
VRGAFRPRLLGATSDFWDRVYLKQPFACPGGALPWAGLLNWDLIEAIWRSRRADGCLVKNGRLTDRRGLKEGFAAGETILIRHAEAAHPALAEVAREFECLRRPIDVQIYVTPAKAEGFGWHYDIEDVFAIQSVGKKEFLLRENTVTANPRRFHEPESADFLRERSRTQIRCELHPGDWLYIPSGYWHCARALEDSYHLSVGIWNGEPASRFRSGPTSPSVSV